MPNEDKIRYKVGEKIYNIPSAEKDAFLTDFKDAVEVKGYSVGDKKYNIPVDQVSDFLKDMPDAKALDLEMPKPIDTGQPADLGKPVTAPEPGVGGGLPSATIPGQDGLKSGLTTEGGYKTGGLFDYENILLGAGIEPFSRRPDVEKNKYRSLSTIQDESGFPVSLEIKAPEIPVSEASAEKQDNIANKQEYEFPEHTEKTEFLYSKGIVNDPFFNLEDKLKKVNEIEDKKTKWENYSKIYDDFLNYKTEELNNINAEANVLNEKARKDSEDLNQINQQLKDPNISSEEERQNLQFKADQLTANLLGFEDRIKKLDVQQESVKNQINSTKDNKQKIDGLINESQNWGDSLLAQQLIFAKSLSEYKKLNAEQNKEGDKDKAFDIAMQVAISSGRYPMGPDAQEYAKNILKAVNNKQYLEIVENSFNNYKDKILGESGLKDIKAYTQAQTDYKNSEDAAESAFAAQNTDLFPDKNKMDRFKDNFMRSYAKNADNSIKKLSPIIESFSNDIVDKFKKSGGKDFVLSSDAGKVPDPNQINDYVNDRAFALGFSEDKYFKTYLKTQLQGAIEYALIEPEVMNKFKQTPIYKRIEKEREDISTKLLLIPFEAKAKADSIFADINKQYKNSINPIENNFKEEQSQLKISYETQSQQISKQAEELNNLYKSGGIDEQTYQIQINNLNVQNNELYKSFESQISSSNQIYLDNINKLNTKYNSQYKRRIEELNSTNETIFNKLKKQLEESGLSAQDQRQLQEAYKQSYESTVNEKLSAEEKRTYSTVLTSRLLNRFASGMAHALRGFGETMDIPQLKLAGEQQLAKSYLAPIDYKKYKNGIGSYILESSSQLAGSMATSMALTIAATATTSGTIMPLIIGGLTGWASESIEIAGNTGADVFDQTGSLKKAEDASAKLWETQTVLLPLYALEAAPFLKGFVKGKTVLGRVVKGGLMEYVPEFFTEYSQNIFEEAIKKGADPYESLGTEFSNVMQGLTNLEMNPSVERAVQTAVDIGPVALLGGGGALKDVYAEKREKYKVGKFVSKLTPADFAPDASSQFVYRTTAYKGKDFATSVVTSLYTAGQISKPQFEQMVNQVQKASKMYESAQKAGLTNPQFVVLSALGAKAEQARELANKEPADSPLKAAMEYRAKTLESMAQKFSANEKVPIVITTLPNGNQVVNTLDEIKERLANPDFTAEMLKGGIKFDALENEEVGKELADLLSNVVESQPTPAPTEAVPVEEVKAEEEAKVSDIKKMSDADIEKRMLDIETSIENIDEFNNLEKEMEKRERESVFNVPLNKVVDAVDVLIKKEKEMPNGWGSFIEMKDASETKSVANKYLNPDEISDQELKKDFKDAMMGNPSTWYADGLKLRESLNEATKRNINTQDLITEIENEFISDGFTAQDAKEVVANRLKPILEGAKEVIPMIGIEAAPTEAANQPTLEDFDIINMTSVKGRKAREELKARVGVDAYKKMDMVNKKFNDVIKDLEDKGILRKECP